MKKLLMTSVALSVLAAGPALANPKNNFSPNGTAAVDTVQSINESIATGGDVTGNNNSSETTPTPTPTPTPGEALAGASLIDGIFGGQANDADSTSVQANVNESLNTEYLYNENVGNTDTYTSDYTSTKDKTYTSEKSSASAIGGSAAANNDSDASYSSTETDTLTDTLVEDLSAAYTEGGAAANNGGEATTTVTYTNESDYSSASASAGGGLIYALESDGEGPRGGKGGSKGSAAANNGGEATVNNSQTDTSVNDYSSAYASSGSAAANNGGSASFSAAMSGNDTSASGSGLAIFASFGNDAVVSNASLQSQVTGTSYSLTFIPEPLADDGGDDDESPAGASLASAESGSGNDYSLSTGENAFQNFAGLQALNLNTGSNASQNANVSVSVASGSIAVGTTVTGGGGG